MLSGFRNSLYNIFTRSASSAGPYSSDTILVADSTGAGLVKTTPFAIADLGGTTVTLANAGSVTLNSAGAVFSVVSNGLYEIFDQADPATTYAKFSMTNGTPPSVIIWNATANIMNANIANYLGIYLSGNNLNIINNLGSTKTFVIHRAR